MCQEHTHLHCFYMSRCSNHRRSLLLLAILPKYCCYQCFFLGLVLQSPLLLFSYAFWCSNHLRSALSFRKERVVSRRDTGCACLFCTFHPSTCTFTFNTKYFSYISNSWSTNALFYIITRTQRIISLCLVSLVVAIELTLSLSLFY